MRRIRILAAVLAVVLLTGRPAQAFHRHRLYYSHHMPVMAAPVAPLAGQPAPISPALIYQLLSTGYHLVMDTRGSTDHSRDSTDRRPQPPRRETVDPEVGRTIGRIRTSVNTAVNKTNSILDLNKDLYKSLGYKSLSTSSSSPDETDREDARKGDARRGGSGGPHGQD
jgi:hypothetical protein